MATSGIGGLVVETHNWGRAVAFWQALGFELEFETDHHSGQLRHPAGGPWVFVAEHPNANPPMVYPVVVADETEGFEAPAAGALEQPFEARHWNVMEALLRDPDDRRVSVQAPLAHGVGASPEAR
jgi:hypothetical protein